MIIRAALPHLEEYKDKFFSYMSMSSPHLGFLYGSGFLVKTGKIFLKILSYFRHGILGEMEQGNLLKTIKF